MDLTVAINQMNAYNSTAISFRNIRACRSTAGRLQETHPFSNQQKQRRQRRRTP
ncbi:hypothetical protein BN2476_490074 [Paraburkholderia piptadeniae]|uniref:Uncharacterized protein n=1 Tax=Paraburkholderia piptadeniae TaxID=1701573 RepID=A0A1N7SF39_9BURK|nr:hypothetical protein BN2476_490074 [Paraburkholderia piptadeniae]